MNFFKMMLGRRRRVPPEGQALPGAARASGLPLLLTADAQYGRRRVARIEAATPVFIYARSGDEPFWEDTKTVNVSVNGGCITLSSKVARSEKIIVTNAQTDEELPCRVARSVRTGKRVVVGLEFLKPCPNFWGI